MITLGAVIGMVMLIAVPTLIPRQADDAQMRFDKIVSAQRRGVEDRLREIEPFCSNAIDMKEEMQRAIQKMKNEYIGGKGK